MTGLQLCSLSCATPPPCLLQVLEHWKFSDLKDWSFSGYSFTLVRAGQRHTYIHSNIGTCVCIHCIHIYYVYVYRFIVYTCTCIQNSHPRGNPYFYSRSVVGGLNVCPVRSIKEDVSFDQKCCLCWNANGVYLYCDVVSCTLVWLAHCSPVNQHVYLSIYCPPAIYSWPQLLRAYRRW